jgi:predicted dehydrogenase/threonine dehydrogenase-like Zn-dependent dehydrogenase
MIDLAKKSIIGKARARPDLVKQVINKVKSNGLMEAYRQAMGRLDTPVPLGYSCAGKVERVGKDTGEFQEGDRVACFGSGYASHAEMVYVPKNLAVQIPEGVSYEEAAFVALGAIALHAVRCADVSLGENVAVIGLGLLGLLTVQLLNASGCNVFGIDLMEDKIELAKQLGAKGGVKSNENTVEQIDNFTNGNGVDSVIIFASAESNQPIEQAAEIARERANIVVPGMVGLDIPRNVFYEKELNLVVSRATGPGIYDSDYEEKGQDYPIPYVRWTENRNMRQFLELVADGKVKLDKLITHRFSIEHATEAYKMIMENTEPYIGVLLEYDTNADRVLSSKVVTEKRKSDPSQAQDKAKDEVGVGLIGAGQYAKGELLPAIKKVDIPFKLIGVATASGSSGKHVAEKFGFDYCTTDYTELLNDENIDVVLIATRHNLHALMIIEALKAEKDVFVEKPLAMNEDELTKLISAVKENQGQVMVGFNRRFSPFTKYVKELFGPINEPVVINCRVNAGYISKDSWVHDPKQGGGRIIGEVCHFVDLIQYLSDSLPKSVYAECISGSNEAMPDEDNVAITIKLRNGSVGSIIYVASGDKSYPREKVEVFGKGSVALINNFKSMSFIKDGKTKKKRSYLSIDRGHNDEMSALFRSIKDGKDFPVDFEEYVYTTLATFKIVESISEGKPMRVDINNLEGLKSEGVMQ